VTVGALNAVVGMVEERIKNASWNGGGCVPTCTQTLKSLEIRE